MSGSACNAGSWKYRANVLLHGDPQGAEPLRKAIATYLNLERGATLTELQASSITAARPFFCVRSCWWMPANRSC